MIGRLRPSSSERRVKRTSSRKRSGRPWQLLLLLGVIVVGLVAATSPAGGRTRAVSASGVPQPVLSPAGPRTRSNLPGARKWLRKARIAEDAAVLLLKRNPPNVRGAEHELEGEGSALFGLNLAAGALQRDVESGDLTPATAASITIDIRAAERDDEDALAHVRHGRLDLAFGLLRKALKAKTRALHKIGAELKKKPPPSVDLGCQSQARASTAFPGEIDVGVFGCNTNIVKDVFTFNHVIPDFSRAALFPSGPSSFTPFDCTGKGTPVITCGPFSPPISSGPQNGLIISVPTLKSGDKFEGDIFAADGRKMHIVVTVP